MKRWLIAAGILLALWAAVAVGGDWVAAQLDRAIGSKVELAFAGKVPDAAAFFKHRMTEAVLLLTTAFALAAVYAALVRSLLKALQSRLWGWAANALVLFMLANVFVLVASDTVIVTVAMTVGEPRQSLFDVKRILRNESTQGDDLVILGSSQANAEIDEALIAESLLAPAQAWDLTYPGTRAADFAMLYDQCGQQRPRAVVCYLSELNLYTGTDGGRLQAFLTPARARELVKLDCPMAEQRGFMFHGLLGYVCPLYRARTMLLERFVTPDATRLAAEQRLNPKKRELNLDEIAAKQAEMYKQNASSDFQKRAFLKFLEDANAAGSVVVICAGQVNPRMSSHFAPAIEKDFSAFLDECRNQSEDVVVLDRDELPKHTSDDYVDLTHVNRSTQAAYSRALADRLRTILSRSPMSAVAGQGR